MDLNFLTELGNKLLEKPKFQKYLGDISASQLNNELSRLTSELKELENEIEASPSGIGVEPGETQEDSRLTREQRKQNKATILPGYYYASSIFGVEYTALYPIMYFPTLFYMWVGRNAKRE